MRFDLKDYFGIAVVAGAMGLLVIHERDEHRQVHAEPPTPAHAVANARVAAIATVEDAAVVAEVTVFHDFTLADAEGHPVAEHQTVVVRAGAIDWVGPSHERQLLEGARVFDGGGSKYLLPIDHRAEATRPALQAGDPADVMVVSDDPLAQPEALNRPLCVMRQGVVVSLSPSLAAAG